jgi:multidrug efflux pump subunit AcrA (membrane-fusion protein)
VEIHPNLEVGEVISEGATLFVIDPRTYQARVDEANAAMSQAQASLERLEKQYATDEERLKTLARTRVLARAEYERIRELMEEDEVGTQSGVDAAEQALNVAEDAYDLLNQAVTLYPMRIKEARGALASVQANLETAEIDLGRTRVVAPFTARVKSVSIEKGQYVGPGGLGIGGSPVLVLADDSLLEVSVPLDSRDARRWLLFTDRQGTNDVAWFNTLNPVTCIIRWTEDPDAHCWEGTLARVEKFEPETRTLTVAVRVDGTSALSKDGAPLPLVEGMFCSVDIPGQILKGAYLLPVGAVSFEQTAHIAVNGRLKTVPVQVSHTRQDAVYVTGGLKPGDIVVTTRLTNPLENTLLDLQFGDERMADETASPEPAKIETAKGTVS